jgi:hypothetical protein
MLVEPAPGQIDLNPRFFDRILQTGVIPIRNPITGSEKNVYRPGIFLLETFVVRQETGTVRDTPLNSLSVRNHIRAEPISAGP